MVDENKLRIATIGLFMRALLEEMSSAQLKQEAVSKIIKHGKMYIKKHFSSSEKSEALSFVANGAWDSSCDIGEIKTIAISQIVCSLFECRYKQDLIDAGFKEKHFKSLHNKYVNQHKLRERIDSHDVATVCIKNINKFIYDWGKKCMD